MNFTPGKMVPKFTGERPTTGLGTRMITLNTAQEMRKYLGDDDGFYTGWTDRCPAMVPKPLKFLTRPLIFRAGGGKPFKKIDT